MHPSEFDDFILSQKWIFAKTYAAVCPHEYIVRNSVNTDDFTEAVKLIREYGFPAWYARREGLYLIRGSYYYWDMMQLDPCKVKIINRADLNIYRLQFKRWEWVRFE